MDLYGKYYKSNGGFTCRYWYHFSIGLRRKDGIGAKFGYWNFWYDGMFHFFNLWLFQARWHKRPIRKEDYEERHKSF
jgi:hypothetical protein